VAETTEATLCRPSGQIAGLADSAFI